MNIFFTAIIFLFTLNERMVEAFLFGSVGLSVILIIILIINNSNQSKHLKKIDDLETQLERTEFERDSQQKFAQNQEVKHQSMQKQLDDAQKKIQELSVIFSDTNLYLEREVRKQTQEIRQANERLQKVVDELDMFIYKTAHDIRGPLARLLGLTNVALLDVEEKVAQGYIQKLSSEATHLNNILARLSVIYEINHAEVHLQSIIPDSITRKVLNELEKMEGFGEMKFEIYMQGDLIFISDEKLMEFILKNLLENSIRFRRIQSNHTSLVKIYFSHDTANVLIQIIDNGIGINPADAFVIFDMFSRAAGIHKTAGLGLYMTKLSVEKLGGNIELITEKTGQTEFKVSIPIMKQA
jgi:signal transduction histidine kinase